MFNTLVYDRILYDLFLLQKEYKGDIHIALAYKPEQDVLNGMILKVTNLEKQDVSGLAGL